MLAVAECGGTAAAAARIPEGPAGTAGRGAAGTGERGPVAARRSWMRTIAAAAAMRPTATRNDSREPAIRELWAARVRAAAVGARAARPAAPPSCGEGQNRPPA